MMNGVSVDQQSLDSFKKVLKDNGESLYELFGYTLGEDSDTNELMLDIVRKFSAMHRKITKQQKHGPSEWHPRTQLFKLALHKIRQVAIGGTCLPLSAGKSPYHKPTQEQNLLLHFATTSVPLPMAEEIFSRLWRVDLDFRIPVILRDILNFDDDEVLAILDTRWSVYRHRLHRGRMDFRNSLSGGNA